MSTASLPMKHKGLVVSKSVPKLFNTITGDAGLTQASKAQPDDIYVLKDTGSDTVIEDKYEPSVRLMDRKVEDKLAHRPRNGYSQRPLAGPFRTRFQKPMWNVTIGFARHMEEQGHDIEALPLQQRLTIQELLAADRQLEEKEAIQAAEAAAAKLPKARPQAGEVFPGIIPPKKRPLHWGRKEHFLGMKNHFNSLQFRRALYEDGVDDVEGLKSMSTDALVKMWMHRRDQLHSTRGSFQDSGTEEAREGVSDVIAGESENPLEATTAEEPAHGPISMAALYSFQEPQVSFEFANAGFPTLPSALTLGNKIPTANTSNPTSLVTGPGLDQVEKPSRNDTVLNANGAPIALLTTDTTAMGQAVRAKHGRGRRKNNEPDPEKVRREAIAARVGRYPLSIPGNNKGEPLSMSLKMSAFTIKQKYNINMTKQLLEESGILPTDPNDLSPHEKLAGHLVKERESLIKSGAQLQEPWTHDRLQAYVAAQEAKEATGPATLMSETDQPNVQVSLHPSSKKLESMTRSKKVPSATSGMSIAKTKRVRDEDLQNGGIQALSQKRLRNGAKMKKGAQVTKQEPIMPSVYVATEYGAAFQPHPAANELDGSALFSHPYASPASHIHHQLDQANLNHQFQGFQNDTIRSPQWSSVG
ncbi:hypothetical protein DPSP01_003712 [Paraphaeosphaeria sporulosa]